VFGKLWVWLIGSGIWHEARTNFGDEEFAFICNYDADKKKEVLRLKIYYMQSK